MVTKVEKLNKEDVKKTVIQLHELAEGAENCLLYLQTAFIYNTTTPLKTCHETVYDIQQTGAELTEKLKEISDHNSEMKRFVPIPGNLLIIGEKIEKISEVMEKKIGQNILFSDKAAKETIYLLQRLSEILWTTSSLILARNTFLGMYIEEAVLDILKKADEYATLHEDRLIEGICLPAASSAYINILDAIKSIAWQINEIARHLVT